MANLKKPKVWMSLALATVCLIFTVACGTNPVTYTVSNVRSATQSEANSTDEKTNTESIVLVDDVPRDTYDVFEGVTTPYQFFQKVKAKDLKAFGADMFFNGDRYGFDLPSVEGTWDYMDMLAEVFNGIKESEITELAATRFQWEAKDDCDAYMMVTCANYKTVEIYYHNDGYVELAFTKLGAMDMNFFGIVKWVIENDDLNRLFEYQINKLGPEGPQELAITEEPITIPGEDLLKYKLTTELDKIILTVTAPDDSGYVGLGGDSSDAAPSIRTISTRSVLIQTDSGSEVAGTEYVERISPMLPSTYVRLGIGDVEGCTVTLQAEKGYT